MSSPELSEAERLAFDELGVEKDYQFSVIKKFENIIESSQRFQNLNLSGTPKRATRTITIKGIAYHDTQTQKLEQADFALKLSFSPRDVDGYRHCAAELYEDKDNLQEEAVSTLAFVYQSSSGKIRSYQDFTPDELMFDWKDILESTNQRYVDAMKNHMGDDQG